MRQAACVFILLIISRTILAISLEKCEYYYENYLEDSLKYYLEEHNNNLSLNDRIVYNLYQAKLKRSNNFRSEGIELLNEALSLFKDDSNDCLLGRVLDELVLILKDGGILDRQKALEYIKQSEEIKIASCKNELDVTFLIKGNLFYMNALNEVNEFRKIEYYNKAISAWTSTAQISKDRKLLDLAQMNTSTTYIGLGKYQSAIEFLSEQQTKAKRYGDSALLLNIRKNKLSALIKNRDLEWATSIADSLTRELDESAKPQNQLDIYFLKSNLADSLGYYKQALEFRDSSLHYQHLVFDESNYLAQEKYQSANLEKEVAQKESRILRNRLWLTVLLSTCLLLIGSIFLIQRSRKIKEQKAKDELEKERLNSKIEAALAKIEGETTERKMIAMKLHDEIASSLTAAQMHLNVIQKKANEQNARLLETSSELINQVSSQVRDISHQLISPVLLKLGCAEAIDELVNRSSNVECPIQVDISTSGERLEFKLETFIYQAFSEMLNNAIKYREGGQIECKYQQSLDRVEIVMTNTVSESHLFQKEGLGTTNIKSRAEGLGGQFNITKKIALVEAKLTIPLTFSSLD